MVTAIIVAAGKSERMGAGVDKAFLSLGQKPVVAWSLLAFERCPDVDRIVLVVRKDQLAAAKAVGRMFGISKLTQVVPGGTRRQDSVQAGLAAADSDTRIFVIHDGARPCVRNDMIVDTIRLARRVGAATVGRHVVDTIKYVEKGNLVTRTEDRAKLWQVQTPQAFTASVLLKAYDNLAKTKAEVTDDVQAVELMGGEVRINETLHPNMKITTAEDLPVAAAALKL